MKLFGIIFIRIILHLVAALSAKSYVIPVSLNCEKNALYFWSFHHIAHLNPLSFRIPFHCVVPLLKVANSLDPDQARLFFVGFWASLALLH